MNKYNEISAYSINASTPKIGLNCNCGPGDVVAKFISENYSIAKIPNHTVGTVIGNEALEIFVPRLSPKNKKPGVYMRRTSPIVQWQNGTVTRVNPMNLVHLNPERAKYKRDSAYVKMYNTEQYVRELPELEFYEYDLVKIRGDADTYEVRRISYHNIDRLRSNGTQFPYYTIAKVGEQDVAFYVNADELVLHSRGNLWHWNTDPKKMNFDNFESEIDFQIALSLMDEITCSTGYWDIEEVTQALNRGTIDWAIAQNFNGTTTYRCYTFHRPEFAIKAREHLKDFIENGKLEVA